MKKVGKKGLKRGAYTEDTKMHGKKHQTARSKKLVHFKGRKVGQVAKGETPMAPYGVATDMKHSINYC